MEPTAKKFEIAHNVKKKKTKMQPKHIRGEIRKSLKRTKCNIAFEMLTTVFGKYTRSKTRANEL